MNNTINTSESKQGCAITNFVITLGRKLLKEKVRDWMDMEGVARFCKQHDIHLNGEAPGSAQLESQLKRFLEPTGEFYGEDVNVDGYERPSGWDRPFMIRAFPYSRSPDCSNTALAELDAAGLATASSD